MIKKQIVRLFLKIFLTFFLFLPALAQFKLLCEFKGIAIPFRLKYRDCVVEKGTYHLESLRNPTMPMCYLRFRKGREIICLVEGERLSYDTYGSAKRVDPSIPDRPTLKMKKDPEEKVIVFIVETGKKARFAFLKLRFTMQYEE